MGNQPSSDDADKLARGDSMPTTGPLRCVRVPTKPIEGQKPGTSGVRKKTKVFMDTNNYLENLVASTLMAVSEGQGTEAVDLRTTGQALLIGGDGRYFNKIALQVIVRMAVAYGVSRIWIGHEGLLSTPAVSAIIREMGPRWQAPFGAFILTASHNPGGPDEDFGIKYNTGNGGPAPEGLANAIYENTKKIKEYATCPEFPEIDLSTVGSTVIEGRVTVEVIDSTEVHVQLLKTVFDFPKIKALTDRPDFSMVYDSMHGVNGPYAKAVFVEELGQPPSMCQNSVPKKDFGGGHADPNLTYAKALVSLMGLDNKGNAVDIFNRPVPSFGAAADGDGDRNMILGTQFFVTPSDSLAIIAAHANVIPFFAQQGGLKGVARSMPTSGAVDRVAKELGFELFETPTGWKYFGNLMDSKELYKKTDYTPFICGEESFGTGSNHVREKDGMWAVLAWLSILASYNTDPSKPLVTVKDIVTAHWKKYGRNYYSRWDFEGMDQAKATSMMDKMRHDVHHMAGKKFGKFTIKTADDFTYVDPVDGSVARKQGIRFLMKDGSRIIFRLSGTAGSGATVRMYMEQYESDQHKVEMKVTDALDDLLKVGLQLCDIKTFCGTETPTVIT